MLDLGRLAARGVALDQQATVFEPLRPLVTGQRVENLAARPLVDHVVDLLNITWQALARDAPRVGHGEQLGQVLTAARATGTSNRWLTFVNGRFSMCSMDVFDELVERAGSQQAIAAACGITPQAVNKWQKARIPAEFCKKLEGLYGIPAVKMRPDIFGEPTATAA